MGSNQYRAGRVYDMYVYYMTGAPEGSPKVVGLKLSEDKFSLDGKIVIKIQIIKKIAN